ncbi:phage protein NinX family protein [Leclercia adecarboxylata]|uniref:phage protein NinX family protein n=1 Tax=Leclercia adecarboxylata TaxID=83655 RepID=UPI003017C32B
MDYSKPSDFEINKAVAEIAISGDWFLEPTDESPSWLVNLGVEGRNTVKLPDYCNNPADAWPIITRNYISLMYEESLGKWCAGKPYWVDGCEWQLDIDVIDENPLRAAMIVFLMMQESAYVQANPARPDIR